MHVLYSVTVKPEDDLYAWNRTCSTCWGLMFTNSLSVGHHGGCFVRDPLTSCALDHPSHMDWMALLKVASWAARNGAIYFKFKWWCNFLKLAHNKWSQTVAEKTATLLPYFLLYWWNNIPETVSKSTSAFFSKTMYFQLNKQTKRCYISCSRHIEAKGKVEGHLNTMGFKLLLPPPPYPCTIKQ